MELLRRLLRRDRITGQAARFITVGFLNTGVDLGVFYLLMLIPDMNDVGAKAVSYFLGICNSFLWNKYWTFSAARSERGWREFVIFVSVNLVPMLVNVIVFRLLGIWYPSREWHMRMGKAFVAALVAVIWNFLGSRYLAFRHTALKRASEKGESDE